MDIEIRAIDREDYPRWVVPLVTAFGEDVDEYWTELDMRLLEFDRTLGAVDRGEFVGSAAVLTIDLTVPGPAPVPIAGVTMVGVSPTHRRRGVNTALMRRILEDVRDRGREPAAGLWSSEGGIYGRFGYAPATWSADLEISRDRVRLRTTEAAGRVRLITDRTAGIDAITPIYDRVRAGRPGLVSRPSRAHWDFRLQDRESSRDGASAFRYLLHEGGDGADGYAVYRVKHEYDRGLPAGEVRVEELAATSLAAAAELFRHVLDVDLTVRTSWEGAPVDTELRHLLADQRALRTRHRDGLWLRVCDPAALLSSRRYLVDGGLVLRIVDDVCPWVAGTYALEGGVAGAGCVRDDAATPDLVMPSSTLASAYLGGEGIGAMARAGLMDEETPGAVARAHAMFATPIAPWCAAFF
jgi:predicted acetyltransferase